MRVGTGILYGTKVEKIEQKKEQRERVDLTGLIRGLLYFSFLKKKETEREKKMSEREKKNYEKNL